MGDTRGLSPVMWPSAATKMAMLTEFCHCTDLMLQYLADSLMPRGIKDIEKDDFAGVLKALRRKDGGAV